ncbi:MAG: PRC-barrel domain-containing protein [Alphaproteobacteria bacterium]
MKYHSLSVLCLSSFAFLCALLIFTGTPRETSAQTLDPYYTTLNQYNRLKPLQNPQWRRFSDVQRHRVTDSGNRVVGNVQDILVAPNGTINAVNTNLNRLQMGTISLNYSQMQMRTGNDSYILGMDSARLRENSAMLMANIETASGNGADILALSSLIRAEVEADDGRRLGRVEEILMTSRRDRAAALLVRIDFRSVRSKSVAIPFSSVDFEPFGNGYKIKLADRQADIILDYAAKM